MADWHSTAKAWNCYRFRKTAWGRQSFAERKRERTEYYFRFVFGWKLRACSACNGSGYYDDDGSPKCGACGGSGRERYKPTESTTGGD